MSNGREWMYDRLDDKGLLSSEYSSNLDTFIAFALSKHDFLDGDNIRCPCTKCRNWKFHAEEIVRFHLLKNGFLPNYYTWNCQGEVSSFQTSNDHGSTSFNTPDVEAINSIRQMVVDAAGIDFNTDPMEEEPNPEAKKFYELLSAADTELFAGSKHSQLSAVARLLNIKSEFQLPENCFDTIVQFVKELIPEENNLPDDFYSTKRLVQSLGLPFEKIDCCKSGCMLYWGVDINLNQCKFCGHPRYKHQASSANNHCIPYSQMRYFPLSPRLQRLYASTATASHMRWHAEHEQEEGLMSHPSDSLSWKHFNSNHPSFAAEIRNIRLGLCTDGFQPFGQSGEQYSSWPIIVTPYNLPPWMCMKDAYMFLTVIIPGPKNPKHKLDVFLQPLIAELQQLWEDGVTTYDVSLKQNFQMRAALMWTVSDFPAFAMLSAWGTAGKKACPYCMDHSEAFSLPNGRKTSWFDSHRKFLPSNHPFRRNRNSFRKNKIMSGSAPPILRGVEILERINRLGLMKVTELHSEEVNGHICKTCGWKKRSIFWDLPYWKTNLIRHTLDVMHIEKNVFDNVFNTVMDIKGKSKDNSNSREDLKLFCNRKELEKDPISGKYPKASYTLDKNQKKLLCEWVKGLKFPDGHVSNLGRCVDMKKLKLFGMKSHDCHVFMQCLLPIAFRELLPTNVWEALTELSLFFKNLTSRMIKVEDMEKLELEIPVILCKLEKIFPPSFFDSMEHLPIHLPYEVKIAGPVQYHWMFPYERFLHHLKKNVKNKARVEGSICNAYLVEEASNFCSYYFQPQVFTRNRKAPRNDEGEKTDFYPNNLSIFTYPGRASGKSKTRLLSEIEIKAAHTYILLNTVEVHDYKEMYISNLRDCSPLISEEEIDLELDNHFSDWFRQYGRDNVIENKFIHNLAQGPLRNVKSYPVYFVNGYRFHTTSHGSRRSTVNSGVCIKGENYSETSSDYYGRILEILELEYPALPIKRTVLFNCEWFDPSPNVGVKVHDRFNLVDINIRRRFNKYEPFILAMQAAQVYYVHYPSLKRDKIDWVTVCKVKPKGVIEVQTSASNLSDTRNVAYQEDEIEDRMVHVIQTEDDLEVLNEEDEDLVDIEDEEHILTDHTVSETDSEDIEMELESNDDGISINEDEAYDLEEHSDGSSQ